jgi:type IV fimbrial biogenesis protein FimT
MLTRSALQRGFSLIELAIALTFLAILLTFGLPQYFTFLQNQQIRASAEGITSGLQFARAEAISRNVAGGVQFVLTGNDWSVVVPATGEILRSQSGKERTPNAVVSVKPAATTVAFNGLGRVTLPVLPAATRLWIDVGNSKGVCIEADPATASMRCLTVTVSQNGQTRMCDASSASLTDPLSCQDVRP